MLQEIKTLVQTLNEQRDAYYNKDSPKMTDKEYDRLFDRLEELEKKSGIIFSNSPTQSVGYYPVSELAKVRHTRALLSLEKTKQIRELADFMENQDTLLMLKLDGLTVKLVYEEGRLVQASTRGDGNVGEDITHNIPAFENVPLSISYRERLVTTGEAFIYKDDFRQLKDTIRDGNGEPYKNARNLASGSVRNLNPEVCKGRHVHFIPFNVLEGMDEGTGVDSREFKLRGVLSGDEADYAIISMPKLFMVASAYISGDRNGEFIYGYADHNMAQITWKIVDQKMTKAYADLMEEHGKKPFGNLQTFIRIVSSDVGASGANIFYSILDGDFTIVLGEALRTKHRHKQGLEEFSENMESIFQYYKQKLRDIGKLCDIRIRYPVNALSEVMKKQSFGKKLIAETVERFKTNFGEQPCSAYEIYCGLCEALFFARKSGSSPSNLVKMEEKIARCMNVRWHDYDIPGEISL